MIQVSVDELTLVMQPSVEINDLTEWQFTAEAMIREFIERSDIETILNAKLGKDDSKTNPSGYNTALHVLNKPYYFSIGYHNIYSKMGVIIKFSAWAWSEFLAGYNKLYEENLTLVQFLHSIESPLYSYRLSRIDIAVDYKNYFVKEHFLNKLYESLKKNKIKVVDVDNKTSYKTSSVIVNNDDISTIYLGSRNANTRKFLRVYDKAKEQIKNCGFRLQEARRCDSWIRMEACFKSDYAHAITALLSTSNDCATTLLKIFLDKYRFFDVTENKYCSYTEDLIKLIDNPDNKILRVESPRDNSIAKSIMHLINESGLFSTMEKVRQIWGKNSDLILLMFLLRVYKSKRKQLSVNREIMAFVRKHLDLKSIDFREYLKNVL